MAPAVELEKPWTPPARCLAFMKPDPTFKLPSFSKSTPSRKQVSSRAPQEENHSGGICSEVGAFHEANSRPKSEVGMKDRRTSSSATGRPCSTHPRLQRGFRVPMGFRGEQWARPPQFDVGREPFHGFPLRPPAIELAGRGGPRRGGPPCCPRCRSQPCRRPFGGRLGARGLPLRASMVPNGPAAQQVLSPGPFVGMAPMRPPLLLRPGMEMIPGGLKQPPKAGPGSRLPPRSVAGMASRWPRPPPGFPRGPRAPMHARLGRTPQYERRVIMDPRTMAGRGRGRPPRPEEAMGLRGELPLPNSEGSSSSSDIFTAAPPWMNALRNYGEFAQPVPVSISTPKDESASPSHDAASNSVGAKAEPASKMSPWAKPHGPNAERSTPNENSGKIDGQEVSSPGKQSLSPPSRQDGVPDWLQTSQIAGTSMIATAIQISEEGDMTAVANDGEGGLDLMKAAISLDTKSTSTPNNAVPVHKREDELMAARVGGGPFSRASVSTFKGESPRDLDPPGAANSNDWLSQAVADAGEAGASRDSTTKSALKLEDPSVGTGDWISAKLNLCADADREKDGRNVQFCASSPVVGAKPNTSVGTLGGWLTSGKLGVSIDHEEEEQVPPVVGAIKKEKKKDAVTADKKGIPSFAAQASGAPGGRLPQAVSSGVLEVPRDNDEQESGDKPNNRETEASPKVSSVEGKRRSSLDGGMPPWAEKPPSKDPSTEENIAKSGGLGGGRPPSAPSPPVLMDKPEKEPPSSGEKVAHSSEVAGVDETSDGGCGLPAWLASVANSGGNREKSDGNGGKRQEQSELFASHTPPERAEDILIAALSGKSVPATPSAQVIPATSKVPASTSVKLETDDTDGAAGRSWLEAAVDSGGQSKTACSDISSESLPSSSKHKLAQQEPSAQGNLLTSGKLGVPSEVQSDKEAEIEGSAKIATPGKQRADFVSPKANDRKKKYAERKAVDSAREHTAESEGGKPWSASTSETVVKTVGGGSTAEEGGPGSWLESGFLGVPIDCGSEGESEGKCEGGGGEGVALVSEETQTEDDIDQIVKQGIQWTSPHEPKKRVDHHSSPKTKKKKRDSTVPVTPDWILKSLGPTGHDASVVPMKSLATGGPDWLKHAVVNGGAGGDGSAGAKLRKKQPGIPSANVPSSVLSWMTKMKRTSSMNLEDPEVEAWIAEAKAKAVPGSRMQFGTLGAPDSVAEEKALEDNRAASPLHRSNCKPSGSNDTMSCATSARRPSLSGGVPTWASKEPSETDKSGEASGEQRQSLTGGLPPWVPVQNQDGSGKGDGTRNGGGQGGGLNGPAQIAPGQEGNESVTPLSSLPRAESSDGGVSKEKHKTTGVDWIKSGITSVQVETSKSSGFDRLKEVAASGSSPHAAVASAGGPLANAVSGIPGPAMVVSAPETKEATNEGSKPDSLGAMATLDNKKLDPRGVLEVTMLEGRTSLATVKVEECYDGDLGIRRSDSRSGRLSTAGVKRIGELLTALARELGDWLESGSRGDQVDGVNGGESKGKCGGGDGLATHVSEETQTEDDIEGIVKEGTESKLLLRAKPWSPTQGPGKIVDYSSPRVNAEEKKDSATAVTPDRVLKSMESPGDDIDVFPVERSAVVTDGGGLDRLDQGVDSTEAPGRDTKESSWEGRAGKAIQSSEESHLLPRRESFTDSKASVKNLINSLTPLEESTPAMAVGEASTEKTEERKHGNCVSFAENSNQPSPKSSNHTCASVKNVASSSVPVQDEAPATTTKETARGKNREETHKQDVSSRPPFIQPVGVQEMGCARPRKVNEEIAQLTEATGKPSTGIQCGKTITGAAPVSVVGNTLGIQVDLGVECRRSIARVLRVDA